MKEEVKQNINRLIHHPSIILWSGNNENEMALWDKTWYHQHINQHNKVIYVIDYAKLFLETIRDTVVLEDPTRSYIHSSPTNGLMSKYPYVGEWGYPNSEKRGDVHRCKFICDFFN